MDENDFIIKEEKLRIQTIVEYEEQHSYPYGQEHPRTIITYKILNYDNIQPCELIRKDDIFEEPFIFFGKKIHGTLVKGSKNEYSNQPIVYYEYVAFNEGRFSKTAKFNRLYIFNDKYKLEGVPIFKIPKDAVIQLGNFLDKKRDLKSDIYEKTTFCKTIYDAVIDEIRSIKMGLFARNINILQEQEQLYEKLGEDAERYRDIIKQMNNIQSEIRSIQSEQLSGPDGFPRPTRSLNTDYSRLYKQKKNIELKYGIDLKSPY